MLAGMSRGGGHAGIGACAALDGCVILAAPLGRRRGVCSRRAARQRLEQGRHEGDDEGERMSTQTPWGGYPDPSESASSPEYQPAPGYPPPPLQPAFPPPPPATQPSFAPPPPPPAPASEYGQAPYPSQPLYPPAGQPTYPSQPLYPPPGQPAYPSQPLYPPPPAYPSMPLNAPNMYVAQPGYPGMPMGVPDQNGGLAIAALVLGILSVVLALANICDTPFFALAIIFGALGLKSRERHGLALAGLILGIVGASLATLVFIVGNQ